MASVIEESAYAAGRSDGYAEGYETAYRKANEIYAYQLEALRRQLAYLTEARVKAVAMEPPHSIILPNFKP